MLADLTMIAGVLKADLGGATAVAVLPSYGGTEREGYWEHAYAVAWRRPLGEHQPDKTGDGHTYGTHRVHVDSRGKSAAFEGHYDLSRTDALADVAERSDLVTA